MVVTVRIKRKGDFSKLGRKIMTAITGPKHVKVGFVAGEADQHNINKAFYNEFGTKGGASGGGWGGPVPERPFIRLGVKKTKEAMKSQVKPAAKGILTGRSTMRQALSKLGIMGQRDIRDSIVELSSPPNSPVTIALKGSSNPLVDTGEMGKNVSWKIDE